MITSLTLSFAILASAASSPSIPALAAQSDRLETLVTAVEAAGLLDDLAGDGPFTVFAPSDAAFARLDQEALASLLDEPGREQLTRILLHHVVPGRLDAGSLVTLTSVTTLAGTELSLEATRDRLLVDSSVVETADVEAANGVVHIIDRVLIPPRAVSALDGYLERAIARGVPLFNDGAPAACAAVYATALEAIAGSEGWGIGKEQRARLGQLLAMTEATEDPGERAWAYRRIMNSLLAGESLSAPANDRPQALFDFSDPREIRRWAVVVDGVMGGLSTGRVDQEQGSMVFTGETSLRNNGGFSSIRAQVPAGSLAGYDALRLRVKGDGRTWIIGAKSRAGRGGDSYWSRFDTRDGEWITVTVPIVELERQYFGTPVGGRIEPGAVRGLEFYMYDKKAGPFELQVEQIEAVRSGESAQVSSGSGLVADNA